MLREVGTTASIGGERPVPFNATATEATPGVLVATVIVAVIAPTAIGVKTTGRVHVPAAARLPPQVVALTPKLPAPGPLKEKLTGPSGAPPELVTVMVLATLAVPICWLG